MKTSQVMLTPEYASQLLLQNTGNRKIRNSVVTRYAEDMRNKKWANTHQGIAIDINGNLIDGQHRLHAVIKSGSTVPMLVTTGLPPESFEVIDKLSARSDADSLRMPQKDAEVYKMIYSVIHGAHKSSICELKDIIAAFRSTYESLQFCRSNIKTFSAAGVRAAAVLAACEKPENTGIISRAYENMLHGNMDGLTLTGRSMVRAVYNGTVKTGGGSPARINMLQKFFTVFCFDNTELTKILPTNIDRIKKIATTKLEEVK